MNRFAIFLSICVAAGQIVRAQSGIRTPSFRDFSSPAPNAIGSVVDDRVVDEGSDGAIDVSMGRLGAIQIDLNDGSGSFPNILRIPVTYPPPPPPPYPAERVIYPVPGRINGDTLDDILVLNETSGVLPPSRPFVFLQRSSGTWSEDHTRFPQSYVTSATRGYWLDSDSDGSLDLALVGLSGIELLLNDGNGRFLPAPGSFPSAGHFTQRGIVADFNGDGLQDLLTANGSNVAEPDVLYLNDGRGSFYVGWIFPTEETLDAAAADIDGDGDIDVLLGTTTTLPGLWINNGDATFTPAFDRLGAPRSQPAGRRECIFADLNGDGFPDVFIDETERHGIWTFLNDGTGHFIDVSAQMPWTTRQPSALRMRDYDRDGDIDISFGRVSDRTYIFHNLHRHVHAPDPRIGGSYDVEIWAPPGHAVTYAVGFARRDVHIPPFGWWALDPAVTVAYPGLLNIPSSGSVTSSLPVPNLSTLRGVEILVQAMEFDPNNPTTLRTTNFDRSVFR